MGWRACAEKFAGKGSTRNPRDTAFWTRSSRLQAKAEALGSVGYTSRVEKSTSDGGLDSRRFTEGQLRAVSRQYLAGISRSRGHSPRQRATAEHCRRAQPADTTSAPGLLNSGPAPGSKRNRRARGRCAVTGPSIAENKCYSIRLAVVYSKRKTMCTADINSRSSL